MKLGWWVALVAAMSFGAQVQAAVVTRSFNVTASTFGAFGGAKSPFSALSADITLTYDDAVSGFPVTLSQFRVMTDGRLNDGPFSATPVAVYSLPNVMRTVPRIVIGGTPSGIGTLTANENDFFIGFNDGQPEFTSIAFKMAGSQAAFLSQDARVRETTVTAAVPEPATWLMLLAGFGMTGAVLRRRRVVARYAS